MRSFLRALCLRKNEDRPRSSGIVRRRAKTPVHARRQRIEQLEDRCLLSISATEYDYEALGPQTVPVMAPLTLPAEALGLTTTASEARTQVPSEKLWESAPGVLDAGEFQPQTNVSGSLIRMDEFRADPRFINVDGRGYSVVVLDSGIDVNHPFFGPDVDGNGIADRIVYQWDYAANDGDASDVHGHGSNVSSIVGSQDATYTGMAPGANLIHLRVLGDTGSGSFAWTESALQWVVANVDTYNIVSVNMSLGDGGNYNMPIGLYGLSDEMAALVNRGVIVVSAAGNDFYTYGSRQGVGYPAADPNSLAIGAVYDANIGSVSYGGAIAYTTAADRITPFSQRSALMTEVFAPGAAITGAGPTDNLVTMHGTSQASPHIAGIAALAQQLADQFLGRRLTPQEFETILKTTGVTVNDGDDENDNVTNTRIDFQRVDMVDLAEAIVGIVPPVTTVVDFTIDSQSAYEWANSMRATVQLSEPSTVDVILPLVLSGTATPGTDYISPSTITIPAGRTTAWATINLVHDNLVEADETIVITLDTPVGALLGTRITHTATIRNDDAATLLLSSISANQVEGDAGFTNFMFAVSLNGEVQNGFDIGYFTEDVTTTAGSDYTAPAAGAKLRFAGFDGEEQRFSVIVRGDRVVEANEIFRVHFGAMSGTDAGLDLSNIALEGSPVTALIQNDDVAALSIDDVTMTEGNSGVKLAVFTVTLGAAVDVPFDVPYASQNGTATAGEDYAGQNAALHFAGTAGEVQRINVPVYGDLSIEPDETFRILLGTPTLAGVTVARAAAAAIIANDDMAAPPGGFAAQKKLLAYDPDRAGERFGSAVAIDGAYMVVGAPFRDYGALDAGAAYVYARDDRGTAQDESDDVWTLNAVLTPADATASKTFGNAVDISDDTIVVGAHQDAAYAGSAYVFVRQGGAWIQQQKLTAADGVGYDAFGWSVSIDADRIAVGAYQDDSTAADTGSVYVYRRAAGLWSLSQKLGATDAQAGDNFGSAVALDGDVLAIGASRDDDRGADAGAVYVFRLGTNWAEQQKLRAADGAAGDRLGSALDVSGLTIAAGAPNDDGAGVDTGAVYVFTWAGITWVEQQKLAAADASADDRFGQSVALSGDTVATGASTDDSGTKNAGSLYVFQRDATTWSEQARLTATDVGADDWFGRAVALSGNTLAGGMPFDDDSGRDSGSVVVLARSGSVWNNLGRLDTGDLVPTPRTDDNTGSSVAVDGDFAVMGSPARDALGTDSGAAYVYRRVFLGTPGDRSDDTWVLDAILIASDAAAYDGFGRAVGVSGDTIVIGAAGDDDGGDSAGSAYVFERVGGVWVERQKLRAADAAAGDGFGGAVGVSGGVITVGAKGDDDSGDNAGAAYVFHRDTGTWSQAKKLIATLGAAGDGMGGAVAVSSDTILVGANGRDGAGANSGAAYVFRMQSTGWVEEKRLEALDAAAGDEFGGSVGISNGTAIVGAASKGGSGAAYVFRYGGTVWNQEQKLTAVDAAAGDQFGAAVAISSDTAIVGAFNDDDAGLNSGSAYVYQRTAAGWRYRQKLGGLAPAADDRLGYAVAIDSDTIIAGASHDDELGGLNGGAAVVYGPLDVPFVQFAAETVNLSEATTAVVINVTLTRPTAQAVTVPFTVGGTATLTADYTIGASPVTIPAGSTSATIALKVVNDGLVEPGETVVLTLGTPVGASLGDRLMHTHTIVNDDGATLTLTPATVSIVEGSGTAAFNFAVTLSGGLQGGFEVAYSTADDTATAGSDYTAAAAGSKLTFSGATGQTLNIAVPILGDAVVELNETFRVLLGAVSNFGPGIDPASLVVVNNLATATITNDDVATLSINNITLTEGTVGTTDAVFTVTLSGAVDTAVGVDFATQSTGTATAGSDFTAANGSLAFAGTAGETHEIHVSVTGDNAAEVNETFQVLLSNLSAAGRNVSIVPPATGTATITNDDFQAFDVYGTTGNDTMRFELQGADIVVTLNGVPQRFPLAQASAVNIYGNGGVDTIDLFDTPGDDSFYGTGATNVGRFVLSNGLEARAYNFRTISARASNAVTVDQALLTGSSATDYFYANAADSSLSGNGFNHRVFGFARVTADASVADTTAIDRAYLFDTPANDQFEGDGATNTAWMQLSTGVENRAIGFDRVEGRFSGAGQNDTATLRGSAAADFFAGTADTGTLSVAGAYSHTVQKFKTLDVDATAAAGAGNDRATISDSTGLDRFTGTSATNIGKMVYEAGQEIQVFGFDRATANATTGGDEAVLTGTNSADMFYAWPTYAYFISPAAYFTTSGFAKTDATGTTSTSDQAWMFGSAVDDTFDGDGAANIAKMTFGTGQLATATGFQSVKTNVYGGTDKAVLHGSTGDDSFVAYSNITTFRSAGYSFSFQGYEDIAADVTGSGGRDMASLYDSAGADTFRGDGATNSGTMTYGSGEKFTATGFERLKAFARVSAAAVDRAFLDDSSGNDLFYGRGNLGQLLNSPRTFFFDVQDFDEVEITSNSGGTDTEDVSGVNYLFSTVGIWL